MNYLKHNLLLAFFLAFLFHSPTIAQVDLANRNPRLGYSGTPAHMWEVGLNAGTFISFGDVDFSPGYGAGIHIRKALDYVFSLRADAQFGIFKGQDIEGSHETSFRTGSLQLLMSINNLIWNADSKRIFNLYLLVGSGLNSFSTDVTGANMEPTDHKWVPQIEAGVGAAFRVTDKMNIGIDSKFLLLLGAGYRADLLDGVLAADNDIPTYSSLRVNFNIGDTDEKSEPLYWVNPMDVVLADISELKARPTFDLTDSDEDGVIDMLDQEPATPKNAKVDTRGISLDSDSDGIPDYKDQEPYSPPGQEVDESGIAIGGTNNADYPTKDEVRDIVTDVLDSYNLSDASGNSSSQPKNNASKRGEGAVLADWFLPMIHFGIDDFEVRYSDYGHLANIAKVMQKHPEIKIVVTGFTDKTASNNYNDLLSFKRAKGAIDHLVGVHEIARKRLILQYSGEQNILVPESGSSFMNRRVEFRVAGGNEVEMKRPESRKSGY